MKLLIIPLAGLTLAACARDDTAYPSLASRPAEGRGFAEPAVTPPVAATADAALETKLAEIGGRLDAIARGYDADASRARTAAASAGSRTVGSEAWIAAQTALAALDDWRAQASGLTAELDDAARERTATVGIGYPALDALRAKAEAEATREASGIAALSAQTAKP